jgi:hypothetical protein
VSALFHDRTLAGPVAGGFGAEATPQAMT